MTYDFCIKNEDLWKHTIECFRDFHFTSKSSLKHEGFFIIKLHMLTNARHNNAGALTFCLRHHDFAHNAGIIIIKMTYWFICKYEVERLAKSAHHSYTLLLTKRHQSKFTIHLLWNSKHIKPF